MHRWVPVLLLIALLAVFRVLGSTYSTVLPNFQPLLALFLCSFIFLQGKQRWLVPGIAWLVTDPVTSLLQGHAVYGWHHLAVVAGVATTLGLSLAVPRRPTAGPMLAGAAASAIVFYFITNLMAFVADPLYPKTFAGFIQAQWTGPVGFGPTWIFLRNLVAANVLFTALFLAARWSLPVPATTPSHIPAR
jgi:hypothetical protein